MTIEKPIGPIKKAVEYVAQDMSEPKDYKRIFSLFKGIKKTNPEFFEKLILDLSKSMELKKELGIGLFNVYSEIWNEIYLKYSDEITKVNKGSSLIKVIIGVEDSKNIKLDYLKKEITNKLENDPRLMSAFSGKEDLLQKIIHFSVSEVFEFADIPDFGTSITS